LGIMVKSGAAILMGVYTQGCYKLHQVSPGNLFKNELLLISINTSVNENMEFIDPTWGRVIAFDADSIWKISEDKILLSREFVKEVQVIQAQGIIVQRIRYNGSISGTKAVIYFFDKIPSDVYVRNGFPKERFDGKVEPRFYLDDRLHIHKIRDNDLVEVSLQNHRFSLRRNETCQTIERGFDVEITPQVLNDRDFGSAYNNIRRTHFKVATQIKNLGLYSKGQVEFYGENYGDREEH